MKKQMLMACWALIALIPGKIFAQDDGLYVYGIERNQAIRDTMVIKLGGNDQVFVIGESLKQLARYEKGDSLKLLFITDWEKAVANQSVSASSKSVHYFVHSSGKRRLKAENEDYAEPSINVAEEIRRLDLDLPKHAYIIHDLVTGNQINIYLQDPAELKNKLGSVSINAALGTMSAQKKDMRKSYKYELTHTDGSYKSTGKWGNTLDAIEVVPSLGLGLIGSSIAPIIGADIFMSFPNKYRIQHFKVGAGLTGYGLAQLNKGDVTGVSIVEAYDLKYAFNVNDEQRTRARWLGLTGGIMRSVSGGSLNGAWKVGLFSEGTGPFNYGFDIIKDRKNQAIYSLTLRFPF